MRILTDMNHAATAADPPMGVSGCLFVLALFAGSATLVVWGLRRMFQLVLLFLVTLP